MTRALVLLGLLVAAAPAEALVLRDMLGREMTLAVLLLAWAVVTLPLSYWPGGSASLLMDMYLKTVAIFWLIANAVDTLPRLQRMAWALTLMAVPLSLTGIRNSSLERSRAYVCGVL